MVLSLRDIAKELKISVRFVNGLYVDSEEAYRVRLMVNHLVALRLRVLKAAKQNKRKKKAESKYACNVPGCNDSCWYTEPYILEEDIVKC